MKIPALALVLICLFTADARTNGARTTMGMLSDVAGGVKVSRPGKPGVSVLSLYDVQAGDVITVAAGGAARILVYGTATYFRLRAGSVVLAQERTLKPRSGPAPTRDGTAPKELIPPAPAEKGNQRGGFNGRPPSHPNGPTQLRPDEVSRSAAPTLQWEGPTETIANPAMRGRLEVEILDSQLQLVGRKSLRLTTREWKVPEGMLTPGEIYSWTVKAVGPDLQREAGAQFRVLFLGEASGVARAEEAAKQLLSAKPEDSSVHLLLARIYERYGMLRDAATSYREALEGAPEDRGIREALDAVEVRLKALGFIK